MYLVSIQEGLKAIKFRANECGLVDTYTGFLDCFQETHGGKIKKIDIKFVIDKYADKHCVYISLSNKKSTSVLRLSQWLALCKEEGNKLGYTDHDIAKMEVFELEEDLSLWQIHMEFELIKLSGSKLGWAVLVKFRNEAGEYVIRN